MKNILCVEDNPEMALLVKETLKPYEVTLASTLKEAQALLEQRLFDLILMDLNLPDGDGLYYLAEKYADQTLNLQKTPLFILSAQNEISSKVMAFALGVDDYIIKPFHQAELRARVESKLKKHTDKHHEQQIIQIGNLKLDLAKQWVTLVQGHQELEVGLTRLEFKLLTKFMKSPERVFSREYLITHVWGDSTNITDRTVDTHIAHLRKKISTANVKIETVTGEGYRLLAPQPSSSKPLESPSPTL